MDDRWNQADAASWPGALGGCVYASRLIGSDPSLVLHGGGNTSVKAVWPDVTGASIDALYVKGSGHDLAGITPAGFAPLPLERLQRLLALDTLTDSAMVNALDSARLDAAAPSPSVETLLHAVLPHQVVLHSHADAVLALTNVADPEAHVRAALGADVVVVPYVKPGFALAKLVVQLWTPELSASATGMVLLRHGLFTFADTAQDAYRSHVDLVSRAEEYLDRKAPLPHLSTVPPPGDVAPTEIAQLRRLVSHAAGMPLVASRRSDRLTRWFVTHPDLRRISQEGPLTPDHVIRTKRVPMLGGDVDAYAAAYRDYVDSHRARVQRELTPLDPAPRVALDGRLGMVAFGPTAKAAGIAADIYAHTMAVVARAEALGGYQALPVGDIFDVEYWELEQAKLRREPPRAPLTGEVAVVTGAASGIGRATCLALLRDGAAVVGIDVNEDVEGVAEGAAWWGARADVTDASSLAAVMREAVNRFGGVDIAVLCAGVFGTTEPVARLRAEEWSRVMAVNTDAAAGLLAMLHPLLVHAPCGGRVVVVGSRNVAAPGPGAAAYSASKAALTQLARVAALEWAADGIRVNVVHPDAVFDTGLWSAEVLAERAASYGLSVTEYKRRNLLHAEVTAADVARAIVALCGDAFRVTTGAQVPVDGGNDRVV